MTTITSGPTGTDGSDLIFAGGGNDSINSGAGNDIIFSGGGNDTINAGAGNDIVFAGSGNDTIDGGSGRDIIFAGAGNDTIDGGLGSDTIDAGAGNDTLIYTYANEARVVDYYNGGSGSDTLVLDFSKYTQWTQASWSSFEATLAQRIAQFKAMVDQYKAANGNLPNSGSKDFVFDFGNGAKLQVAMTEKVVVIAPVLTTLNHAPVITSGPQADAVQEDGTLVVGGMVTATDANTGDVLTYSGNATGVYGSFSVADNGKWTYTLANGNNGTASKVQSLGEGEIQTETFTVTVSDGKGGSATQNVAITITGTNDAPVITSDVQAGEAKEDGTLVVRGTVTATDIDIDNAALTYSGDATGVYGSFTVDANGVWTYTLDNGTNGTVSKVQSLAEGEIQTEIFTVTVSDGKGGTATQDVTITITGTNDAPVVKGAVSNSADEDGKPVPLDALAGASDVDNDTELQVINVPQTLPAGVTYDADTHMFTLDPGHPEYQTLGEGVKTTVVVNYGISDGRATTSNSVQWVVTGTNDDPKVVSAVTGSAKEDGLVSTLDAFVNIKDVDTGDVLTVVFSAGGTPSDPATAAAMPAGLGGETTTVSDPSPTITDYTPGGAGGDPNAYAFDPQNPPRGITYDEATHSFSLNPSDKEFQSLGEGETRTVTISYFVSDGKTTIPATLQWVVTGTNDVPIVLTRDGDSASADLAEGNSGLTASGSLSLIDPDVTDAVGARVIGVTAVTAYTGALPSTATLLDFFTATSTDTSTTVPTNLRWEFDSKTEAFDFLSQGQELVLTYTVEVNDKHGGTATQDVTVTITGTNDAPVVSGAFTGVAVEGWLGSSSGALDYASDEDNDALQVVNVPTVLPGGVTYDAATHQFALDPSHSAYQSLAAGATKTVSVTYYISDGTDMVPTSVQWTVTGTNDTPVVSGAVTGVATEDGAVSVLSALTNADDVDVGNTLEVVGVLGTLPAGVTYDALTQTFSLDPSASAYQGLTAGETETVSVIYFISDGTDTVPASVQWTVTGTNDAPTVTAAVTGVATEDGAVSVLSALTNADDVDFGDSLQVVNVPTTLPAGVTYNEAAGTFSLDPSVSAYQGLAAGVTKEVTVTYGVSDGVALAVAASVKWTVTGTNDAPNISAGTQSAVLVEAGGVNNGAPGTASAFLTLTRGDVDGTASFDGGYLSANSWTTTNSGATYIKTGTYGSATLNSETGVVTYALDNTKAATQGLTAGLPVSDSFTVQVTDGLATTTAVASFAITGTNDAPTISASTQSAALVEAGGDDNGAPGTASAFLTLTRGDVDGTASFDGGYLSANSWTTTNSGATYIKTGTYGKATLNSATGVVTYALDNTQVATQGLTAGQPVSDSFTVQVTDGLATKTAVASFAITGTNDAPTISASKQSAALVEAGGVNNGTAGNASATIKFTKGDVDGVANFRTAYFTQAGTGWGSADDGLTYTRVGKYGAATFTIETGFLTYTLDNKNVFTEALNQGQVANDAFIVQVTDNFAVSSIAAIFFINGTNDASTTPVSYQDFYVL
jgi:VCBS repeat-containing protein